MLYRIKLEHGRHISMHRKIGTHLKRLLHPFVQVHRLRHRRRIVDGCHSFLAHCIRSSVACSHLSLRWHVIYIRLGLSYRCQPENQKQAMY